MSKSSTTAKEQIRNISFLIFGGIGSLAAFPAVLVTWSEYAASLHGVSRRFPPEKIAVYRNDLIFSLVILALFVFIMIYPLICRKLSRLYAVLPIVGLTGLGSFIKIALEVAEVVKDNRMSDPELNVISTYGLAILSTTLSLAFFLSLFVYYSCASVKEYLDSKKKLSGDIEA